MRGGDVVDDYFGGGIDGFLGGRGRGFFLLVAGPVACVFVFIVRYSYSNTVPVCVSCVSCVSPPLLFFLSCLLLFFSSCSITGDINRFNVVVRV